MSQPEAEVIEDRRSTDSSRPSIDIEQSLTVVHPTFENEKKEEKKKQLRWYLMTVDEVQQELFVSSLSDGLQSTEVEERRKRYGLNSLKAKKSIIPLWIKILVRHTFNFMMLVLAVAGVLSFALQEWVDAVVICLIILLNIVIGFVQEFRSEQSMAKLQQMTAPTCIVTRNGNSTEINTSELVPGDIVSIKMGSQVPADLRLFKCSDLECNEALLTGESTLVAKQTEEITTGEANEGEVAEDIPVGDRKNMVFMSSTVAKGNGKGIVIATGMKTEIGRIAKKIGKKKNTSTELQKRISKLGIALVIVAVISIGITILSVWLHGKVPIYPDGLKYALTIAVSIIPESLMSVLTLTIGLGVRQMSKSKAIIRKLTALETLGSLTDICSDKTGTLTEGKMFVYKLMLPSGHSYSITRIEELEQQAALELEQQQNHEQPKLVTAVEIVADETGEAVSKSPEITERNQEEEPARQSRTSITGTSLTYGGKEVKHLPSGVRMLITVGALCNTASVKFHEVGQHVSTGDPTEIALSVLSHTVDMSKEDLEAVQYPTLIKEFPFDSSIKRMTVIYEKAEGKKIFVMTKGAVDRVLPLCNKYLFDHDPSGTRRGVHTVAQDIDEEILSKIRQDNDELAEQGMRVLCLAYKEIEKEDLDETQPREQVETDLVFLGLVGIQDPPRIGVAEAVKTCQEAGIKVRMVTGDHPSTARAIAKQIGIIPNDIDETNIVMKATDFDALTDEELAKMEELPLVIARCSPQTKVRLIEALHARKKGDKPVVVMTGDGVNDAPAITRADVGVSMGIAGSDVTKEASDIVLADDNFVTIVKAVREGRRICDNIKKFLIFLLTTNAAQAMSLLIPVVSGLTMPMNPIQILWINLIVGAPTASALGCEVASKNIMKLKKRKVKEPMFSIETIIDILLYGAMIAAITLVAFFCMSDWWLQRPKESAQAVAFTTMVFLVLAHTYNCRSQRKSIVRDRPWRSWVLHITVIFAILCQVAIIYIPWVNSVVFHQNMLMGEEWAFVFSGVVIFIVLAELYKLLKRLVIRGTRKIVTKVKAARAETQSAV
jgi:magnesium-transporting ATPase (P-type)